MDNEPAPAASPDTSYDPLEAAMTSLDAQEAPAEPTTDLLMDFAKELSADEPEEVKPEAPETPKAEDPPAGDDIPDKPKNKDDWNKLRGSRDELKKSDEAKSKTLAEREERLKSLEAELTETKAKAARVIELEERAKLADEYEKELAVTRVEATRDYKATIAEPLKVIGDLVETLSKENEADVEAVYRMINEVDPAKQRSQFKEITAGWDEVDRLELRDKTREARVLLDKQFEIRSNAHAAAKETERLSAERAEQQKVVSRKEFTAAADTAIASLREKVPFIPLADGETEDGRFGLLKTRLEAVDFDSQTPRGKAFAAATALMYPQMLRMMQKQAEEIATYKAAVGKKQSGKPSVSPNHEPSGEDTGDFFKEFGIQEPASFFATSGSIDVRGT